MTPLRKRLEYFFGIGVATLAVNGGLIIYNIERGAPWPVVFGNIFGLVLWLTTIITVFLITYLRSRPPKKKP